MNALLFFFFFFPLLLLCFSEHELSAWQLPIYLLLPCCRLDHHVKRRWSSLTCFFFLVATTIGAIPFRALLWTAEWMSGEFSTSQSQDTTWPLAPAPPLELMTVSVNSLIYDCARMAFAAFFSKLSHNNNSNSNACTHSFTYFSNVARSRAR